MELEQVIRQIYRVPVKKSDRVNITVDGSEYEIVNLGSHGIGIRLPNPAPFKVSDHVHKIGLKIEGDYIRLSGKIVHVTPYETDHCLCGIQLIDMDEKSQQRLLDYVYRIRANLFTKG
jgi:c-di-GMP-binding flagellar brake protein YcgR